MNREEPPAATTAPPPVPDEPARLIAERTFATWRRFDVALAPIIGRGGVAALYRRSLFLTRSAYPWLPGVHEGALAPVEFMDLQAAVSLRTAAEAQAATDALGETFRGLLTELIGASLTERLLRHALVPPTHGDPVQDDSP
jgi:hypothetical protein